MTMQPIIDGKTWNEWLAEHLKTCETCRESFEEMSGGMCAVAFQKFKDYNQIAKGNP